MIWLVGSGGMLGTEVQHLLQARGLDHQATGRDIDITRRSEVARFAKAYRPRWILNCAAYTAVDRAESEEDRAFAVNAEGARHLAQAAHDVGARLIHVSTDYVFDGRSEAPYQEDAPTAPLGAYGRSKDAGERLIRATCPDHVIVRTAWLHGPHGPNFVATMLRLMAERPALRVVDDQRGRPTYTADLAAILLDMVACEGLAAGTYHYANAGTCTWYGFARAIQAESLDLGLLRAAIPIEPIASEASGTPAPRPANADLATDRLRAALGITPPTWQDGLSRHLHRIQEQHR
jgi:dTDP-4-dehydrorhamnose reductase